MVWDLCLSLLSIYNAFGAENLEFLKNASQQSLVPACWDLPLLLLHCCLKLVWTSFRCQMLSMSGPQQAVQSYKQSMVCGCLSQVWLSMGRAKLYSKCGFFQYRAQGWISKHPKAPKDLPLPVSASQPAVTSHRNGCFWKGFWWNQGDGTLGSTVRGRCHSDFREDGGWDSLPKSESESVLDYFPELGRVEPLVGRWVGPLEPRVWFCWIPGWCFYWLFLSLLLHDLTYMWNLMKKIN